MRTSSLVTIAVICSSALFAAQAIAASDYLLEIDGINGESNARSPAGSVEVSSFSWGTSHTTTSPRDAATGLSTGKMQQQRPSVASEVQAVAAPVEMADAPATKSIKSFSLTVAEPGNATAAYLTQMCASGRHIPHAVLTTRKGRYELTDVMVTSCAVTGNQRRHEFSGHVTLMK